MASGTRGTPLPSDISKCTHEAPGEVRNTGDGSALGRFLPSFLPSYPGAPPALAAAALGRHPVVPLRAAASEGACGRRRTGWQSLRDSDPCGCRASPRACGTPRTTSLCEEIRQCCGITSDVALLIFSYCCQHNICSLLGCQLSSLTSRKLNHLYLGLKEITELV